MRQTSTSHAASRSTRSSRDRNRSPGTAKSVPATNTPATMPSGTSSQGEKCVTECTPTVMSGTVSSRRSAVMRLLARLGCRGTLIGSLGYPVEYVPPQLSQLHSKRRLAAPPALPALATHHFRFLSHLLCGTTWVNPPTATDGLSNLPSERLGNGGDGEN